MIAEWGQSHLASVDVALRQAQAAKDAGCSHSKWQVFEVEDIASQYAKRYWDASLGGSESQAETFQKNGMLGAEGWRAVKAYCDWIGIEFLATPFSLSAVDLLESLGVEAYKLASADITYERLIRKVAATGKAVFLSTGASSPPEVLQAVQWLRPSPTTVLACSLIYPCPPDQANLRRITMLQEFMSGHRHVMGIGYSDHTECVETALAATALGATTLEKHVTLGGTGVPDDLMAISADCQLPEYVRLAHLGAKLASGNDMMYPADAELPARFGARRSLYATRDIPAGARYQECDVIALRPWDTRGYAANEESLLIGTACTGDVAKGELILRP